MRIKGEIEVELEKVTFSRDIKSLTLKLNQHS